MMTLPEGVVRTTMGVYLLSDDDGLSRAVGEYGRLTLDENWAEITHFARYIPAGGVVIDAGAAQGDHTEVFSLLVGVEGHVYAFEPHPRACAALRLNTARLNNVTVRECALGYATSGIANFALSISQGCSSVFPSGCGGYETSFADGSTRPLAFTSVAQTSLDSCLLPQLTRCDFLHFDMEGSEPFALIGAQELIRRFRPVIVVEVGLTHLKRWRLTPEMVLELLALMGYTTTDLNDIVSAGGEGFGRVWNVLAVPTPGVVFTAKVVPTIDGNPVSPGLP
mgnify:CR=1 FL=1